MKRCPNRTNGTMLAAFVAAALALSCVGAGSKAWSAEDAPAAFGGAYPVELPTYDGVEQVHVLSSRWIVLGTTNVEAVLEEIDERSGGRFHRGVAAWKERLETGKGKSRRIVREVQQIWNEHAMEARKAVSEFDLDTPGYYSISSPDDEHYENARHPTRASYHIISLDDAQYIGAPDIHYGLYSYIEMPSPLRDGKHYTVTLKNGKRAAFRYDEQRTISRAIKVNQVGYLPDTDTKYAYLGAHIYGIGPMDLSYAEQFHVIDAVSGEVVLSGPVTLREKNPQFTAKPGRDRGAQRTPPPVNGENVCEMDLSDLKATGNFFITIPNVGRSWTFHHGPNAYGEAFYTSMRGFYHQRCGIACEPPYTQWPRQKCHQDPVYESDAIVFGIGEFNKPRKYRVFDVIGATTDTAQKTEDATGGWHDAADWDRNARHYSVIFDLLYAYEWAPGKFTDGQLNIPESGNGVPDILDEVDYGLRVWTKSMDERGGVSGSVQTWTHPPIDADINYTFSKRTRWSSLLYAAAAAQLAQHLHPFDEAKAKRYAELAAKAYQFGANPEHSLGKVTMKAAENRGRGAPYTVAWEEKEAMVQPYLVLAKVRMYLLTNDTAYTEDIENHLRGVQQPTEWPYTFKDYSPWFYFALLRPGADILPEHTAAGYQNRLLIEPAERLLSQIDDMPYRRTWPRHQARFMGFGATDMTNPGRLLFIAHRLTGDPRYREAAILNADFMFGANPLGMSWTTGIGSAYPVVIQHAVSENDGIMDPVPGITLYGVTDGLFRHLARGIWNMPGRRQLGEKEPVVDVEIPMWRRWYAHPRLNTGQCEFTVHETMASTAFTCAALLSEGWKPSDALKNRQPRDKPYLFGYWYLP